MKKSLKTSAVGPPDEAECNENIIEQNAEVFSDSEPVDENLTDSYRDHLKQMFDLLAQATGLEIPAGPCPEKREIKDYVWGGYKEADSSTLHVAEHILKCEDCKSVASNATAAEDYIDGMEFEIEQEREEANLQEQKKPKINNSPE